MKTPRVIVTRVQPQAASWVEQLNGRCDALALPLLETRAIDSPERLQAYGRRWSQFDAVMFVSSQALKFFFQANPGLALVSQAEDALETRVWVTGPGTRAAALALGVPAARIDVPPAQAGQFDSEALWQQVQSDVRPGMRVLIVRGDSADASEPGQAESSVPDLQAAGPGGPLAGPSPEPVPAPGRGRDWLAQTLQAHGVAVEWVAAYQRAAPDWGAAERELARAAASDGSVWLFTSAQALTHLQRLMPDTCWTHACALATHERIAQAASELGFGRVQTTRPTLADVLASIESPAWQTPPLCTPAGATDRPTSRMS